MDVYMVHMYSTVHSSEKPIRGVLAQFPFAQNGTTHNERDAKQKHTNTLKLRQNGTHMDKFALNQICVYI